MIILFADLMIVSLKWRLLRVDFFFCISSPFQWSLDSDLCSLSISMPCVVGWVIYEITKLHVMNRIQSGATLICMIFHVQSADSLYLLAYNWPMPLPRSRLCVQQHHFIIRPYMHHTYQGQRFVFLFFFFFFFSAHCVAVQMSMHIAFNCALCNVHSAINKTECVIKIIGRYGVHRAHHVILGCALLFLLSIYWNRSNLSTQWLSEPN